MCLHNYIQQAIEYKYIKIYILIIALCIIIILCECTTIVCYSYIIELHAKCMYIFSCVCQGHKLCMGGGGGGGGGGSFTPLFLPPIRHSCNLTYQAFCHSHPQTELIIYKITKHLLYILVNWHTPSFEGARGLSDFGQRRRATSIHSWVHNCKLQRCVYTKRTLVGHQSDKT